MQDQGALLMWASSVIKLCVFFRCYAECHYAECHVFLFDTLSVAMLSVNILSAFC
jgi:hypothetical protein